MQTHDQTSEENFVCDDSQETVDLSEEMDSHEELNMDEKLSVSTESSSVSSLPQTDRDEAAGQMKAYRQTCKICGKSVANLRKHRRTHRRKRACSQACEVCGKVVNDMYKHKKVHREQTRQSLTSEICCVSVADMRRRGLVRQETGLNSRSRGICRENVTECKPVLPETSSEIGRNLVSDVPGLVEPREEEEASTVSQVCEMVEAW